jgi:hypothetical protein
MAMAMAGTATADTRMPVMATAGTATAVAAVRACN